MRLKYLSPSIIGGVMCGGILASADAYADLSRLDMVTTNLFLFCNVCALGKLYSATTPIPTRHIIDASGAACASMIGTQALVIGLLNYLQK
jgi:hypothetical protein